MIEEFISRLQKAHLELTPEEIADILWLAPLTQSSSTQESSLSTVEENGEVVPPQPLSELPSELPAVDSPPNSPEIEAPLEVLPEDTSESVLSSGASLYPTVVDEGAQLSEGEALRAPTSTSLPCKQQLIRSLRPLFCKTSSRTGFELDVMATVHSFAQTKFCIPVLHPNNERWLDLILVVDQWRTMVVWDDPIQEFTKLLEQTGKFRKISIVGLYTSSEGQIELRSVVKVENQNLHQAKELLDPSGRRAILMVSDCLSPIWINGSVANLLKQWQDASVVLLQPLPEFLWDATNLRFSDEVNLFFPSAASPNRRLNHKTDKIKLPVITLESRSVGLWSKAFAGDSKIRLPGYILCDEPSMLVEEPLEMTSRERYSHFMASVSPEARKLAVYLSAVPLTLPIMHLVRQIMMPDSNLSHLAEVILGGLMRQVSTDRPLRQSQNTYYEFYEGVRELLQDNLLRDDAKIILSTVGGFMEDHWGVNKGFGAALLTNTHQAISVTPDAMPFARISLDLLRRYGAFFNDAVKQLENGVEEYRQSDTEQHYSTSFSLDVWKGQIKEYFGSRVSFLMKYANSDLLFGCVCVGMLMPASISLLHGDKTVLPVILAAVNETKIDQISKLLQRVPTVSEDILVSELQTEAQGDPYLQQMLDALLRKLDISSTILQAINESDKLWFQEKLESALRHVSKPTSNLAEGKIPVNSPLYFSSSTSNILEIPTLVIGLGGTGKQVVLRVKERLIEAYGAVPKDKKLFLLDTDVYGGAEYNGVTLLEPGDRLPANNTTGYREIMDGEAEFYHVSNQGGRMTLDQVLPNCIGPEYDWLDEKAINKTINFSADRVIARGAGTVRQMGKLALYLDYKNVYNQLQSRLLEAWDSFQNYQTHQDANFSSYINEAGQEGVIQRKLNVFVASSIAGGSGAGMVVDILRMVEAIIQNNPQLNQNMIQVITLLVGGKVITGNNPLALGSTYAVLRELERLGGVPSQPLSAAVPPRVFAPAPVGVRENPLNPSGITFLFDQPNRQGMSLNRAGGQMNRDLDDAIYPSVADLITALSDNKIGALFDSSYPDIKNSKMRRFGNINGYFPFCSAGAYTIIFPEQDIRRSAGLELLTRFWSEYLVRTEKQEASDPFGVELDPVTLDLWNAPLGEQIPSRISPIHFTDEGFHRTYVCKGVLSPRFIQAVVRAALRKDKKVELPPRDKFLTLFGGKTNVERVIALIGVEKADQKSATINDYIQQSIDIISQCEDFEDIQRWKQRYLGSGPWGNSRFEDLNGFTKNDTWLGMMKHEIIGDIRAQFRQSLEAVVVAILNDKAPAYRLEYAWRVLRRLVDLSRIWWVAANQGDHTVLELNFSKEYQITRNALRKITETEIQSQWNFAPYRNAVRDYARAYSELVAVDLLSFLCQELEAAAENIILKLNGACEYHRKIYARLVQQKRIHDANREKKENIVVRKYVTSPAFEKQLTEAPIKEGLEKCKLAMSSDFIDGDIFWWKLPFSRNVPEGADFNAPTGEILRSMSMTQDELVARAMRWACTCNGNPDRVDEDGKPIFANLGRNVRMADRVMQHIGLGRENDLAQRMVGTQFLASRCPIQRNWPSDRLLHFMALPEFGADDAQDNSFYRSVKHGIQAGMGNYDNRWYHTDRPANPRAAIAFEIATGFKMEHLDGMDSYRNAYLNEVNHGHALHCLPEERNASIKYETAFNEVSQRNQIYLTKEELSKQLYGTINVAGRQLDPIVVDVLGNEDRIELFIKGLVTRVIGLPSGGLDYAIILPDGILRLSRMSTEDEINSILSQLAQSSQAKIPQLATNQVLVARLRLMYALRVFVVSGRGWIEERGELRLAEINYKEAAMKISEEESRIVEEADKSALYAAPYNTFLKWFTDYEADPDLKSLADMGLVLARVAWNLYQEKLYMKDSDLPHDN